MSDSSKQALLATAVGAIGLGIILLAGFLKKPEPYNPELHTEDRKARALEETVREMKRANDLREQELKSNHQPVPREQANHQ